MNATINRFILDIVLLTHGSLVNTCGKTSERENMRADCNREVQTLFICQILVYLLVLKLLAIYM